MTLLKIIGLFLFSLNVLAQNTGSIEVTVTKAASNEALPLVNVSTIVEGQTIKTVTNEEGKCMLKALPMGKYDVTIAHEGYQTNIIIGVFFTLESDTVSLEVDLEIAMEEEIIIKSCVDRMPVYNRYDTTLGQTFYRKDRLVRRFR